MIDGPDPFTNYEMKGPKTVYVSPADSKPEISLDVETLRNLGEDGLINLVQRIAAARWGDVALMSDDAIAEAMMLKLAHGALTGSKAHETLNAMNAWLDRKKGKPVTPIAAKIETSEAKPPSSPAEVMRKIKFVMAMAADEERKRLESMALAN